MHLVSLLLPLFLASLSASPLQIEITPETETFSAILTASGPDIAGGSFAGTIALNGSGNAVKIEGRLQRSGGRLVLPIRLRYVDVPADWADRFRLATFDYRVRGRVGGRVPVEWAGTLPWNRVEVKGDPERSRDFFRFNRLALAEFSFFESEANAEVSIRNPFSFPIRIASSRYRLSANGHEIGEGQTREVILRPRARNTIRLPIGIDNRALLATAGSTVLSGGDVDGRIRGELRVRVARGEVAVPLNMSGQMSIVR